MGRELPGLSWSRKIIHRFSYHEYQKPFCVEDITVKECGNFKIGILYKVYKIRYISISGKVGKHNNRCELDEGKRAKTRVSGHLNVLQLRGDQINSCRFCYLQLLFFRRRCRIAHECIQLFIELLRGFVLLRTVSTTGGAGS